MNVDPKCLDLIRDLSNAFGAPGFEDEVTRVAAAFAAPFADTHDDCLRNLYLYRKEHTGEKPVLLLDAHSDETAFMVHSIRPNGTLRFVALGGWNLHGLAANEVLVRNKHGEYIPGIIVSKPVHFLRDGEKTASDIADYSIDVGATSPEEAAELFGIRIGEPVVPATRFRYDEKRDLMIGKAFDCRIGCAVVLEVLRQLQGKDLPFDVVGVLSTQEEMGDRGIQVALNEVKPAVAIALEGCPADDTFTEPYAIQTAIKKGPMLRHMDVSLISTPRFQRLALDLAEELGLPVQSSVREGGGNNGAMINLSGKGVPVIVSGVPVRHIHSFSGFTTYQDFDTSVQLVLALIQRLTPETVAGF